MSFLKKVIRAVKKMFKATVKRRPARKRKLKAKPSPRAPKRPKKALPRPAVRKTRPAPAPKRKVPVSKKSAPAVKKAPKGKAPKEVKPAGVLVGEVTHYFDRIKVCVIRIDRDHIKKGDRLLIKGGKSELFQNVTSMQIENEDVPLGKKGQMIGLKVAKPVGVKDGVYKT
jgi:hypothetical protein